MRGRFISLEGGEGAGKSTQLRRLSAALGERGVDVVVTREPGGSEGAEAIRTLLMQGDVGRWSPRVEALLFAAARSDHVERVIGPAIEAGRWVLCDRFIDSTRAYQGVQGIDDAAIMALHGFGSAGLLPDRTYFLDVPPETGAARAGARDGDATDRFGMRATDFHTGVAAIFDRIAQAERDRVRRIDASGDPHGVTQAILADLSDLLP